MSNFKDKWDMVFIETLHKIETLVSEQVTVTEIYEVFIGDKNKISGIISIIDDILLFCSNLESILVYSECVYKSLKKVCDLLVGQVCLLKIKNQTCWSRCH